MLTKAELAICANMGVSASDYIVARRARALGVSINVAGSPYGRDGGRGRQVMDEAAERLRGTGALPGHKDKTTSPGALLAEAAELCDAAYAAYRANPDSDEAWMKAGEAGAYLEEALERFAPAYANRPGNTAEDAEGAPGEGCLQAESRRSHRIGAAIQRMIDPMLKHAGAVGLATVARPLTTTELAICAQMGIPPAEYLAAKARQRAHQG